LGQRKCRPNDEEDTPVTVKERTLTAAHAGYRTRSIATGVTGALALAGLTWLGANVYIPLYPVPITLQTLFVLLAGSVVARRTGIASQWAYVGAGALGVPVFAGGLAGWGVLAGPTGGFLLSFLIAPVVVSLVLRRSCALGVQIAAFAAGTAVIFVLGVAHLALFYTHDITAALHLGLFPFVPGAIFKIVAAVSIHRSYTALTRR
jgi:biotin transport system substrate-specific component